MGSHDGAELLPFSRDELEEIPLERPPLERVVAQVRFPLLARVAKLEAIADLQGALQGAFPHLEADHEVGIALTAEGSQPLSQVKLVWRLWDRERRCRLSIGPTFLALDTSHYRSRNDFLEQLERVLEAMAASLAPAARSRLGVRYVNRIHGQDLHERIHGLVRRETLGIAAADQVKESSSFRLGLSEAVFELDGDRLRVRAALLPERARVASLQLEAVDSPSWVLDLDMFREDEEAFEPAAIATHCRRFTERIYRFFRWSVTDELLRFCGGRW